MSKQDELLAENIRRDIEKADSEIEGLHNVITQIDQFEEDLTEDMRCITRDTGRVYEYWRGAEAQKCVNTILDSSQDSVKQIRMKANTFYDEATHDIARLELKREDLKHELTSVEAPKEDR